jgi:diaminohydroxyphosphoribosylaminopyrimidine deaminase/5-amino-6-(5-phosphoribosylamino)uracil reductase
VLGAGWHHAAGTAHAEALAIAQAGTGSRGGTLYVSLEPCAHVGRTPPCSDLVIDAGISRVVIAMRDPDPRVDGRGVQRLRRAGIEVTEGVLTARASALNVGFITRVTRGRPFVLLKVAMTLDARVGVPGRRYVSGEDARAEVHRLRNRYDAVLVGIGTILADDPQLSVRRARGRDPLRIILDTEARTPLASRVVREQPGRTIVMTARNASPARRSRLRDAGVLLLSVRRDRRGGIDLAHALGLLAGRGINTVLAEPGPRVAGALVRDRLVDRLLVFIAPALGGAGPLGFAGLATPRGLEGWNVRRFGGDLAIEGTLR